MTALPCRPLLDDLVQLFHDTLDDALLGVYLHGSLAMGCFNPQKSDIDLLAVGNEPLDNRQKMRLMQGVVALNALVPEKGIDFGSRSVLCDGARDAAH